MTKRVVVFIIVIIIASIGIVYLKNNATMKPTFPIDDTNPISESMYKASFAIYTNGIKRDFSLPMYHNLSRNVYITSENPNIILVENSQPTWDDFFATLPFSLTKTCLTTGTGETYCTGDLGKLRFFINGSENPDILDALINPFDRLLVSFGNESDEVIQTQIESIPVITTTTACTLEAKICPDGTSVGRTGPNCEFAPCL